MRFIATLIVVASLCGPAYGQALTEGHSAASSMSLPDLSTQQLKRVFVTTDGRKELSGRLLQVDRDTLLLLTDDHQIAVPFERVRRIQTAGDSLHDGARIGALVLGLWSAYTYRRADPTLWSIAVAFNAGVGAAIGAGIDAASPGRTTIYRAPSSASASLRAARPRAQLSFRF